MENIYVMSDIHGDYPGLQKMMRKIEFSRTDKLFILGDVVDRGSQNLAILDFTMSEDNVQLIKGNHEYFMQIYLSKDKGFRSVWSSKEYGGKKTIEELDRCSRKKRKQYAQYLESLPLYKKVLSGGGEYVLTHSGWLSTKEDYVNGKDGKLNTLLNIEKMIKMSEYEYLVSEDIHLLPSHVKLDIPLIIGHVPTISRIFSRPRAKIYYGKNYIDIDCGNGFQEAGGKLSCLSLVNGQEYYI